QGKYPSFSPRGNEIAFAKQGSSYEIFLMNKDGTNIRQLTNNEVDDVEPLFSPSGERIAYSSGNIIYLMRRDGSKQTKVVDGTRPVFSPDGNSLAFLYFNTAYTLDLETLELEQIKGIDMREIKKEEIKGLRQIEEKVKGIFWSCGSVENKLPVPIITGGYTGYEGMPISLDGSSSYDPDGTITTYTWEINEMYYDGSMTTIVIDDDYIGSLTLRVIDNDKGEAETQTTITILNLNPQITLSSPSQGKVNYPIQFIAEVFDTDPITFLWDFGDLGTSTSENPIHSYTNVGTYTITLRVSDDDGGQTIGTKTIEIIEANPEIKLNPKEGYIATIITIEGLGFNGVVSIDFGTTKTIATTLSSNGMFLTTFMADTQPLGKTIITARDKERFATETFAIGLVSVFTKEGEIIGGYLTIKGGIDACPIGGSVLVLAGDYLENLYLNQNISLIGKGATIQGSVTIESNNSLISGFKITQGIFCINGANPIITNNIITENNGIYCSSSSPIITNNTIVGNKENGIYCLNSSPFIYNNIIAENASGIYVESGNPTMNYNDVWNNSSGNYYNCPAGANDISDDPQFQPSAFSLQPSSPCIDAGSNTAPAIPATDKDGKERIINGIVDLGAYEFPGEPARGTIAGMITYNGTKTGTLHIALFNNPLFSGDSLKEKIIYSPSFPQPYTISNLEKGSYYLLAFLDLDDNDNPSIKEPLGIYGSLSSVYSPFKVIGTPIPILVFRGSISEGIDLELTHNVEASKEWTFIVYLDADNSLESWAIDDFLEMAKVGSDYKINIVVQMDRIEGGNSSYGNWTKCHRFLITKDMEPYESNAISDWGDDLGGREVNMGDPDTLRDFINWATTNYPAKKYSLILWNHGGGWRTPKRQIPKKGVCVDDTSGDILFMSEVKESIGSANTHLNLIGFDMCFMAMVEVAYALRGLCDCLVGSEEFEWAGGWPYDAILGDLANTPSISPKELASIITTRYGQNSEAQLKYDTTQSALDMDKLGNLIDAIDSFAESMNGITDWEKIKEARQSLSAYSESKYFHSVDLYFFADKVKSLTLDTEIQESAQRVKESLISAIIANYRGKERDDDDGYGSYGLSIYFPKDVNAYNNDPQHYAYEEGNKIYPVDYVDCHRWDNFLRRFYDIKGGTITGKISYQGTKTGILYYQAFNNPQFSKKPIYYGTTTFKKDQGTYTYTLQVDLGTYYLASFLDLDNNGNPSIGEPFGIYGSLSFVYYPFQVIGTANPIFASCGSTTEEIDLELTKEIEALPILGSVCVYDKNNNFIGSYTAIQQGINNCPIGGTVSVSPGIYNEAIYINKNISLIGAGADICTITASGLGYVSAVTFDGDAADNAIITGFTITGANRHGISCINGAEPIITNNTISGNYCGIYCDNNSSPKIINNTISRNGEGIYGSSSSPSITNNTISENYDGIYCHNNSSPIITNNIIFGNNKRGIFCIDSSPKIINNTISGHWRGIYCLYSSFPSIASNTISGNSIGIYAGLDSRPNIINNTISGNKGDGIFCDSSLDTTITNNIISENGNAGIYYYHFPSPIWGDEWVYFSYITNNTISQNKYGIYCYISISSLHFLVITNSIISKNKEWGIYSYELTNNERIDYNCIWGNGQDGNNNYYNCSLGPNNISSDPQFIGMADFHLQPSSPCRDKGLNTAGMILSTDKDGKERIVYGIIDLGAYEFQEFQGPPIYSILMGRVTDISEVPIEGARIEIFGPSSYTATTDENGKYIIFRLVDGKYTIFAKVSDFYGSYTENVEIKTGTITTANFRLNPIDIVYVDDDYTGIELGTEDNPFNTIMEGISLFEEKGTVMVCPGTYSENILIEKRISLVGIGTPTIFPNMEDGLTFKGNKADNASISFFMITGGRNGICCYDAKPVITNNIIAGNIENGIFCFSPSTITHNTIMGNLKNGIYGHSFSCIENIITDNGENGISCLRGNSTILNNTIAKNRKDGIYGNILKATIVNNVISDNENGISCSGSDLTILNNTIAKNRTNGIFSTAKIVNNIIAENGITKDDAYGIYSTGNPSIFNNCLFRNGLGGSNNYKGCDPGRNDIYLDPQFISLWDYHLRPDSPCIDVGKESDLELPLTDKDGKERIKRIIDLGAYEFQGIPTNPKITPMPKRGSVGKVITIEGLGFLENHQITIDFGITFTIATTYSSPKGTFFITFIINTQPPGINVITAGNSFGVATSLFFLLIPSVVVYNPEGEIIGIYPTIQDGIDVCPIGGTVSPTLDAYIEAIYINKRIALIGKGTTTISSSELGEKNTLTFEGDGADFALISGFNITGARKIYYEEFNYNGIGIFCKNGADPIITKNIISGNSYYGIFCKDSSPTISDNIISKNGNDQCDLYYTEGGIRCENSSSNITNNIIAGNRSGIVVDPSVSPFQGFPERIKKHILEDYGSYPNITNNIILENKIGIACGWNSFPNITNNTILRNLYFGGFFSFSFANITNNIIVENGTTTDGYGIYQFIDSNHPPAISMLEHNCVWNNGLDGNNGYYNCFEHEIVNNISLDPQFIGDEDYHLQSTSFCIDTGLNEAQGIPVTDKDGNPRIQDGNNDGIAIVDMGAYEYPEKKTALGFLFGTVTEDLNSPAFSFALFSDGPQRYLGGGCKDDTIVNNG
ncbi:MAG: right-handed parallel beta-helix repeat-containing protein, partial [bacterium]